MTKLLYTDDTNTRARYEHNYHVTVGPIILLFVFVIVAGTCLLVTSILF